MKRQRKPFCTKYLTVINSITFESVPFIRLSNGEIKLNSTNKMDTEDICIVSLTDTFYEHSIDFRASYIKI